MLERPRDQPPRWFRHDVQFDPHRIRKRRDAGIECRDATADPGLRGPRWPLTQLGVWTSQEDGKIEGTVFSQMPKVLDYGNLSGSKAVMYGSVLQAAREAGEVKRAEGAWQELLDVTSPIRSEDGIEFPNASIMALAAVARGDFSRKGGILDIVERGLPEEWSTGPILSDVPFDDATVGPAEVEGKTGLGPVPG